ncbi:hypothetical protein H072_4706 [Dactylellina haptotyla CBS 200.50]|uniref:FAM86 N-terminal domain-containing protein n=1 Tax=Dactylellina haptotyla (strain CBS 200.50) TaxID=1284197 RepID=S8AJV3_DACHA|nr:hypothetical protein H072_4706 [Dactylellina haptotyla CBS 200.50]
MDAAAGGGDGGGVLIQLKRLYLQSVPANKIPFDGLLSLVPRLDWAFQDQLFNTVLSQDATAYPPTRSYTRLFLKTLIGKLEQKIGKDEEIHDEILILYSALLSQPESIDDDIRKPTNITYLLPSVESFLFQGVDPQVVISERKSLLSANGHTGSRTWEAALALGEYFLSPSSPIPLSSFGQLRVIELGAGTGFTSILLSKLRAKYVLATDGSDAVCDAIKTNIDLNGASQNVSVSHLLWGECQEQSPIYSEQWNLVVGGDITYDTRDLSDLVYTLKRLLRNHAQDGTYAIISATVRNESTIQLFEQHMDGSELAYERKELSADSRRLWYYGSETPIRIYTIRLKSKGDHR